MITKMVVFSQSWVYPMNVVKKDIGSCYPAVCGNGRYGAANVENG